MIPSFYVSGTGMNATMRPWLEQNVGIQGVDWDWMFNFRDECDEVQIKFRKGKERWATIAQIMWQ